tara:strand:+ start:186 stop:359 length:174 start_codon:yes stop_codon:yes gene_type:complete
MEELKLVGILIGSLLLQLCLFPFRAVSFIFAAVESVARIIKKTVNNLIELIQEEIIK